mgnify:FL=1
MQRRLVAVILCVAVFVLRVEGSVLSDALSAAFVDVGADGNSSLLLLPSLSYLSNREFLSKLLQCVFPSSHDS